MPAAPPDPCHQQHENEQPALGVDVDRCHLAVARPGVEQEAMDDRELNERGRSDRRSNAENAERKGGCSHEQPLVSRHGSLLAVIGSWLRWWATNLMGTFPADYSKTPMVYAT